MLKLPVLVFSEALRSASVLVQREAIRFNVCFAELFIDVGNSASSLRSCSAAVCLTNLSCRARVASCHSAARAVVKTDSSCGRNAGRDGGN